MPAPGVKIRIRETRDVAELLKKLPEEVREKALRKSLVSAATIFAKEVRNKAARLDGSSYDRPSWGRNQIPGTLSKNITRPRRVKKDVPNHIIKVRVTTKNLANKYAAMAEYGHKKWIFGNKYEGRNDKKTPPVGFWRSSNDQTRMQVEKRIREILKAEIGKLINA